MFKKTAYINASVYTLEKEGDKCSAFVVEDGKFVYCGTDEEARALADEVVDLGGKTVLPGLIDTHQHLYSSASNLVKLTLDKVRSMKELKEVVREYAKTVPAFFAILRALNAREDLTEQQVKEVLPFFFSVSRHLPSSASLVASDWTQEFQTQLEDMVCLCVQRVRDKTALLQQSLNAVVNNTNPRIHLLLIHAILVSLEQAVDYDFSDLFVTLLQHVLALLRSAATVAPSSSIQSMLSVMGDCLARMSFMPQNKELVALWTALWTTADATLAALLVDFFDKNLPLLDHSLYSSFLTAALLEPSFVRVALEVWLNASVD